MRVKARRIAEYGFSLTEIMIVVSIVGMLIALAIPCWHKARAASAKSTCLSNLQKIDSAKELWALDYRKRPKDSPRDEDLFGPDCYIRAKLNCPAGGEYVLEAVKVPAYCTFPTHNPETLSNR
jgi:prepilin-type N-terminal cleavage/methylation domain-containing protein